MERLDAGDEAHLKLYVKRHKNVKRAITEIVELRPGEGLWSVASEMLSSLQRWNGWMLETKLTPNYM